MFDIDFSYIFKVIITFLINSTVSFLLLIVLLYILIINNKHTVYQQRLVFSFYFFSLLLLILVTAVSSSTIDKYNHLILPKYPNNLDEIEITNIVDGIASMNKENLARNLHKNVLNLSENEADFYNRYESVCFKYISAYFPFDSNGLPKMNANNINIKNSQPIINDDILAI